MPEGPGAGALAAELLFVAQGDVENAALSAVHRVEPEWRARVFHFFGGGADADPQFLDPEGAVIVGIEGNARMIVGMEPQNLLRDQLQSEQELRAVGQQQFHVATLKLDDNVRIFKVRMTVVAGLDGEAQIELAIGDDLTEKLLDPGTSLVNRILGIQALFLSSFGFFCHGPRFHGNRRLVEKPLLGNSNDVASEPV